MPNGGGGTLKMTIALDVHDVDREKWHLAAAGSLRAFADHIETNGLDLPNIGKITIGPARCEYVER
jgi:hypothetical protein